jgi:ribosomal protein S27AE
MGRQVNIRPDWEQVKLRIMATIVFQKFNQNKDLAEKLILTGDAELIEGNYWGDTYWGICTNKTYDNVGENYLGKILMFTRTILKMHAHQYREVLAQVPTTVYKPFTTEEELKPSPVIKYTTKYEIKDIDSFNVIKYIDDMLYKLYYGNAREEVCINTALVPKDIKLVGIPFINSDHKMEAICPKCGMTIDFSGKLNKETMEVKTKTKFCQYCGQKFNWFTRHLF